MQSAATGSAIATRAAFKNRVVPFFIKISPSQPFTKPIIKLILSNINKYMFYFGK